MRKSALSETEQGSRFVDPIYVQAYGYMYKSMIPYMYIHVYKKGR